MYSETITQRVGLAAPVNPQAITSQTVTSGGVDMSKFRRAFFILEVGSVVAGGALTVTLIQSASSNLAAPTTVNGPSSGNAQITGLNTANRQYTFDVRADELAAGQQFVGLQVQETGGHAVQVSVVGYGDEAIRKPGSAQNDASVAGQTVVS
jgi:hypothetical protein